MKWVRHVVHMREVRNAYKILVGNSEGKIPLASSGHNWGDNIKIVGHKGVDWIRRWSTGKLL